MAGKVSKHCRPFLIRSPRSGIAPIIFSFSLMQTVNGILSIKYLFISCITSHFLTMLYRVIWMTVTALFHFVLAMCYKWATVCLEGLELKWLIFFLTPDYLYIYLFAILIKGACVFNRLRVPPSVCMRIRNLTEGDVDKGFLYLFYYCCLSLIYMHINNYEFLLMIRQHILPSNANLSPWK